MILQVRVEDCGLNFNFIWALRFLVDVKMDEKKEEEKKNEEESFLTGLQITEKREYNLWL